MKIVEKIRLSSITCSDRRMDIIDDNYLLDTPINKYKVKCESCRFPDIDTTPDPYYLAKNRVFTGIEIMEADLGNLFISGRLKKIFEILFPGSCNYKKTYIQETSISTNWWLAIPVNKVISGKVKNKIPRCKKCNEPLHAHPGSQYKSWIHFFEGESDIIKSENWHSSDEEDWKRKWLGRDIFLSVRLILLLKKIEAKGIYQYQPYLSPKITLTKSEKEWADHAITKIGDLAISTTRKEITTADITIMMTALNVKKINTKNVEYFENKFKSTASELVKILCSIDKPAALKAGVNEKYKIADIKNWELQKKGKKLISFAYDSFGNSLQFDPKDKLCPIYFYDHETMIYELTHSSILDMIK